MTHKSIKLLALAVIFGCSLIGSALAPTGNRDYILLLILAVLLVTGIWFLVYWFLCDERQR